MAIRVTLPYLVEELDWPDEIDNESLDIWAWVTDPHVPVTTIEIANMPKLTTIVTASTGMNHIPMQACAEAGIEVYSLLNDREGLRTIKASSEATFMLLLMVLRNTKHALNEIHNGRWQEYEHVFRGNELFEKKVGIIGLGRIGSNMFKWCSAFGADIWHIYDPYKIKGPKLEELFEECDVVIVSCSLTEETHGMIGYDLLSRLKRDAVLVNTARGEVVVEKDLERVLLARPDIRVGTDVLAGEVTGAHLSSPLWKFNNVTIMPHMAGITKESQTKAAQIACKLLCSVI